MGSGVSTGRAVEEVTTCTTPLAILYDRVLAEVADTYQVKESAIRGRCRDRRTTDCRGLVSIYLREAGFSYPAIGEVSGREHTSIMRLCRVPRALLESRLRMFMRENEAAEASYRAMVLAAEIRAMLVQDEPLPLEDEPEQPAGATGTLGKARPGARCPYRRSFDWAVDRYWSAPEQERQEVWTAACQSLFPNTWKAQASMPPRAVA